MLAKVAAIRGAIGGPWSPLRVVPALVADARGVRDKIWILFYFLSRQPVLGTRVLGWLTPRPRDLWWHSAPTPLSVSVESGGLSPWYETSIRKVYAPTTDFEPQPGWVIVDVGANIGAYSVWAAAQLGGSGKLVAIEPNPVSYKQLERSIGHLILDATAVQSACGEAEGEVILHFERGYTVSSSINEFAAATESVPVQMRRLEHILREHGIGHVDVLKIDVEGAEEMVLRGAGDTLLDIDRVVIETTEGDLGFAVRKLLQSRNLVLVHEEQDHWSIPGLELLAFRRPPNHSPSISDFTPAS